MNEDLITILAMVGCFILGYWFGKGWKQITDIQIAIVSAIGIGIFKIDDDWVIQIPFVLIGFLNKED